MSEHFSSEQDLFENKDSDLTVLQEETRPKRNSFGPRLPINTPKSPPRVFRMAGGKGNNGKGKAESSGGPSEGGEEKPLAPQGGSVIGFSGFTFDDANPGILIKKSDDGSDLKVNVFENVFSGGELTERKFELVLNYLHRVGKLNFQEFIEGISYQGFNRIEYIKSSLKKVSVSVFCRFAILGAIRGSNFDKIKETCLVMPNDLAALVSGGQIVKKAKRRDDMTILRFTASIPHWVAFWLFSVDIPKKIESEECPGWLQFPGAASLPMGKKQRLQHISFCKAFSSLLPGGDFKGTIYFVAYSNPIPEADIPSIIKDQLGIGKDDKTSGEMTRKEVQDSVTMAVVKK